MIFNKIVFVLAVLFTTGMANSFSFAARISETGNKLTTVKGCSLLIEGQIAAGDAAKIEEILERTLGATDARQNTSSLLTAEFDKNFVVCLSGPGGSYLEGLRLGELFAKFGVVTVVPDNMTCESACAIAFLGGQVCCDENGKPVVQRYLYPGSKLGFHAPTLNLAYPGEYTRENALQAYDLGLEVVARLRQNAELLSINDVFLSKIFAHRGQDFYYIKTLDDAEFNDMLLTGYRTRKLKRDTNQAACWNAWNWHVAGPGGVWFNFSNGSYNSTSDRHWNSVFREKQSKSNRYVRGKWIYVFYPFDGSVDCLVREVTRKGHRILEVIISEGNVHNDSDPHVKGLFRQTLLMRGNRTLESTR